MGATFDATESADLRWWPVSEGVEHEQEIPAITRAALTQLWHSCGGAHVAS